MQTEPGPHGITEVGGPTTGDGQQTGPLHHVGRDRRRPTVAGGVDPHHFMIGGQLRRHRTPRPTGLGEAVDQNEPGAGAVDLDVEHGAILACP
jgi:hypothetical protein